MESSKIDVELASKIRCKNDLKTIVKDFVSSQAKYLDLEREEEERQTLDNIFNFSSRELEKKGVCIRKLDLLETVYESYGKYLTSFQKRTTSIKINKNRGFCE
jgi:hypothetical protein